jgi:hypothetical protein
VTGRATRTITSFWIPWAILLLSIVLPTATSAESLLIASRSSRRALLGLGVNLGDPSSLNAHYFITDTQASDAAFGFGYSRVKELEFKIDHLWYVHVTTTAEYYRLPWYVGAGAVTEIVADSLPTQRHSSDAKVPFDLVLALRNIAEDPFILLTPGVELFGYAGFKIDGSLGVRIFF